VTKIDMTNFVNWSYNIDMDHPKADQPRSTSYQQARAGLILDVAAELLQRYGYKRVTIEDVATRAGIGKGTIYLHWKTREALFNTVLAREYATAIEDLVQVLRRDPSAALPEHLTSTFYRIVMQRPLLKAAYTADLETLGRLGQSAISKVVDAQEKKVVGDYLSLLSEFGLTPSEVSPEEALYAFLALMTGFFLFEPLQEDRFQIALNRRSEILGITVQRVFGTRQPLPAETVQSVATRTIEIFAQYAEIYRTQQWS
jgi:AcrR family transcriptional regulator